ncbi:MAG: small multi-drug export protein [Candidatus Poseidonia sp.]|nr:small multi-drug export protein [Poseidonia sp.]
MANEGEDQPSVNEAHEEHSRARDKEAKELQEIRQRRQGGGRMFLSNIEDFVLIAGLAYGLLFALLLFSMSSGVLGNSTALDHTASTTFLDIGDECDQITEEPWLNIFPDPDEELFSISGHNLPNGVAFLNYSYIFIDGETQSLVAEEYGSNETTRLLDESTNNSGRAYFRAPYSDLAEGHYELRFRITVYEEANQSSQLIIGPLSQSLTFEHSISSEALAFLPFVDDSEHSEVRIEDAGPRSCWSVQDLGDWGYLLMGAEIGGGRETAMLTGGAAGIPAWWMAFISLSLSIITLLIIYPVMYKVYHQDTDDILSRNHIVRLVEDTVETIAEGLNIDVDQELFKTEVRELSIDIMVAYKNTESTLSDSKEVRSEILRQLLEEFAIFRVFKPVQLNTRVIGAGRVIDFDSGVGIGSREADALEVESEQQDYSSFFSELHSLSRIEDDVRDSLDLFFTRRNDVEMKGAVVTSDDRVVFVSVIYRPTQRFAFFRFNKTSTQIKDELFGFIHDRNEELLGSQELIVKTRNEVSTLADRSGAGRVERQTTKDDERIVAVAKQDGLGGRMLQTKFLGDTLSTVEYMANEKREMINKWGFWGLIFFVWIPFMASGVLVGAMLGLLSRMQFMRVLLATLIGGSIASITWAYTAEGIVKFMHQYKLEVFIPMIIGVFILMAVLHIRSTKMRRQTELFEDTLLDNFHADVLAKYGDQ